MNILGHTIRDFYGNIACQSPNLRHTTLYNIESCLKIFEKMNEFLNFQIMHMINEKILNMILSDYFLYLPNNNYYA